MTRRTVGGSFFSAPHQERAEEHQLRCLCARPGAALRLSNSRGGRPQLPLLGVESRQEGQQEPVRVSETPRLFPAEMRPWRRSSGRPPAILTARKSGQPCPPLPCWGAVRLEHRRELVKGNRHPRPHSEFLLRAQRSPVSWVFETGATGSAGLLQAKGTKRQVSEILEVSTVLGAPEGCSGCSCAVAAVRQWVVGGECHPDTHTLCPSLASSPHVLLGSVQMHVSSALGQSALATASALGKGHMIPSLPEKSGPLFRGTRASGLRSF